jgi:uncharacterized lipoprotein YmbA
VNGKPLTNRAWCCVSCIALLMLVSGCGQSTPVRYYKLDSPNIVYESDSEEPLVLGLGPLRIPDYLERNRIVVRGENSEMIVDDFSRWAEPLDDAIYRLLAANVDSRLEGVMAVSFPYNSMISHDYQLLGRIDMFESNKAGNTVLLVHWGIIDTDGNPAVAPRRARYQAQATDASDYGSIATAMRIVLEEFSQDIAQVFQAAIQ